MDRFDEILGRARLVLAARRGPKELAAAATEEVAEATDARRYLLADRDGDYVAAVEYTGWDTVKLRFVFTRDRARAMVFTHEDLFQRNATNPLGQAFVAGFSGSQLLRHDLGQEAAPPPPPPPAPPRRRGSRRGNERGQAERGAERGDGHPDPRLPGM
jgi:hypothetical protein